MLNRRHALERVGAALRGHRRVAVLRVRVARLREYEAMFGYAATDALGDMFQQAVRDCLRPVDDVVTVGECDLLVALPGVQDAAHAELAAAKVARRFLAPVDIGGRPTRVVVTVGVVFGEAGAAADALCLAAYAACQLARHRPERYALAVEQPPESFTYGDLHTAIAERQLQVHLQPIFSLATGQLRKFEALARWHHPQWGAIRPDRFVAMAEQTGLIEELTRWSINATLRHCAPYLRRVAGLKCAINISPIALEDDAFPEQLAAALRLWGVRADSVALEITETAFFHNFKSTVYSLLQLHDMGCEIAIDDFGTGYSSLAYLRDFPVDELKIDMGFVRDMLGNDGRNERLVVSMIDMAHRLELRTVAEGIESSAVWSRLQALGCDCGQGYYPGRPMPAEEALARFVID